MRWLETIEFGKNNLRDNYSMVSMNIENIFVFLTLRHIMRQKYCQTQLISQDRYLRNMTAVKFRIAYR